MTADAVGGVWGYSLELADALARRDVEVTLAVMGGRLSDVQRRQARGSSIVDLYERDLRLEWMGDPWADVDEAGRWLLDLAGDTTPDIVHLNGYAHGALRWPAPTVVVGHSCVFSWWSAVRGGAPPPEWREYRRRITAGLDGADAVVAPTAAMLAELGRWYGLERGIVIPNCRSTDWVRETPKEPMIASAGRVWDDAKNMGLLDRAARELPWPVVIAGDAGGRTMGAAALTGPLSFDELALLLARASVFALPARYEPFGLAALEAALSGCALVLGNIASLREVWDDAAIFVDTDDEGELVSVARELLDDPAVAAAWGARARVRAGAYTTDRTADAYLRTYRGLPVNPRRPVSRNAR